MTAVISEKAFVDPRAELDDDVEIGPFCVVGPDVTIGRGTRLLNNVTLTGCVTIGEFNQLYPGVVIGAEPQDLSYRGSRTRVEIGDRNVFRECVTVNRATEKEEGVTTVGSRCLIMACCHIAHDCYVGDGVVIANGTLLAGHVRVHHHATLSGSIGIHHFTTVGSYSFIGGMSRVLHDVPPYMLVEGNPSRPRCVNVVALKRNNFPAEYIQALNEAHRLIYRAKVGLDHAREILRSDGQLIPPVNHLLNFIQEQQEGRHGRARERRRAA
ncbi:MAG: acyl-ACP--UDP-N-acetylglucosamine O-acyltransferase [Pirellulaceae bacterium]|jgi:UDP-N-acetylglucosamine acyltransferase|nr:acyl-ACP--UDP-N-acetylglucosamine O-acyltransferase [Pirellulaceae bacterium]